jgi:hypothetical protein
MGLATYALAVGVLTLSVSTAREPKKADDKQPGPITKESLRGQWEGPEHVFAVLEFTEKKATLTHYPNGDGFLGETAEFNYAIDRKANVVKLDQGGAELLRVEAAKAGKLAVTTVRRIQLLPKGLDKALFTRVKEKGPKE